MICAIPPLSPQPPDFYDPDPTHIQPLFAIPFPDGIVPHCEVIGWNTVDSWYLGSSHPLYFDMLLCRHSRLHRFKLIVESDLSDASLHFINTSDPTPHNFDEVSFQSYRICEDTLVSCWIEECQWSNEYDPIPMTYRYGVYTGLTSTRFSNLISHDVPAAKILLPGTRYDYCCIFLCPASGRFVLKVMDGTPQSSSLFVLDFF